MAKQMPLFPAQPPSPEDRARGRAKNDDVRRRTRRSNKRIAYVYCGTCGAENVVEAPS